MDSKNIQNVLVELDSALKEQFLAYRGLYLFGSYAKGCATSESDIDVLLDFDSLHYRDRYEIAGIVCDVEYHHGCFIDYKILDERKIDTINPLILDEAINRGIAFGR